MNNVWKTRLHKMCLSGDIRLVQLAIEKGALSDPNALCRQAIIDYGFLGSCRSGNIDVVKLIMSLEPNNFGVAFYEACKYGHLDVVMLISKYVGNMLFRYGFYTALEHYKYNVADYLVSEGLYSYDADIKSGNNHPSYNNSLRLYIEIKQHMIRDIIIGLYGTDISSVIHPYL